MLFGLALFLATTLTALPPHLDADKGQILACKAYADYDGDDSCRDDSRGDNEGDDGGDDGDDGGDDGEDDGVIYDLDPISAEDEAHLVDNRE